MPSSKRIKYVSSRRMARNAIPWRWTVAFKIIYTYVQFNYSISILIRELRFSYVISPEWIPYEFYADFSCRSGQHRDFFLVSFLLRGWPRVDDGHRSLSIHRQRTIYPVASPEIIGVGRRVQILHQDRSLMYGQAQPCVFPSFLFNDIREQYSFTADKI